MINGLCTDVTITAYSGFLSSNLTLSLCMCFHTTSTSGVLRRCTYIYQKNDPLSSWYVLPKNISLYRGIVGVCSLTPRLKKGHRNESVMD